jgi:hypothetical protein
MGVTPMFVEKAEDESVARDRAIIAEGYVAAKRGAKWDDNPYFACGASAVDAELWADGFLDFLDDQEGGDPADDF